MIPICFFLLLSLPTSERIAEGEFIKGVMDNEDALRLIQYEPANK